MQFPGHTFPMRFVLANHPAVQSSQGFHQLHTRVSQRSLLSNGGDEMYIVIRGAIDVQVDPKTLGLDTDTGPTTIATLRQGQVFGELALVDQGLRSASARVATNITQLLVIKRDDLIFLCEEDYKLGYLIMRNIAAEMAFKIRGTDLIVREQLLWRPRPQ